jgi:hypothetical protein
MEPMTDALRRINRAKKHLNILNREIKAFIASEPYRCTIFKDPQDGRYIYCPYLSKPIPKTWGLLIGEVAHGLHSALDNIAWSLATVKDEHTEFPIFDEESSGFTNKLKKLPKEVWVDIMLVQPYNAKNGQAHRHPLWILRRIDNIDKHRLILSGLTKIQITTGFVKPKFLFIDGFTRLNKGDVQFKVSSSPDFKIDFKPEMTGHIVFDISTPPIEPNDTTRVFLKDLFIIHDFVRNGVYPRFAEFLKQKDG